MRIRELAKFCRSNVERDCDICDHKKECDFLKNVTKGISPAGLIDIIDFDIELSPTVKRGN